MNSKEFKKIMARRMLKSQHRFRVPSKADSHSIFSAKVHKKALPHIKYHQLSKDPEFASLSQEEYERKYP